MPSLCTETTDIFSLQTFKKKCVFLSVWTDNSEWRGVHDHLSLWLPRRLQPWLQLCRVHKLCHAALGGLRQDGYTGKMRLIAERSSHRNREISVCCVNVSAVMGEKVIWGILKTFEMISQKHPKQNTDLAKRKAVMLTNDHVNFANWALHLYNTSIHLENVFLSKFCQHLFETRSEGQCRHSTWIVLIGCVIQRQLCSLPALGVCFFEGMK